MSLQRRLFWLLIAFVAFCLASVFGTIYMARLHVGQAMADLQQTQTQATWLEHLRLAGRERCLDLREVVIGLRADDAALAAQRDEFFGQLHQVARFTLRHASGTTAEQTLALSTALRGAFDTALAAAARGETGRAQQALGHIETALLPELNRQLQQVQASLDTARAVAVDSVVLANTQLLVLAVLLGGLGIAFVLISVLLMRRWMLVPIQRLEAATRALGEGRLDHRVAPTGQDELGRLGVALNDMADKLTRARVDLGTSEAKYRALFQNLRDATLICDAQGVIIECQEGETSLLGRLGRECVGRSLLDVCPTANFSDVDWPAIFGRVLTSNEHIRVTDLLLRRDHDPADTALVDVIAFPVEWSGHRFVALVLRDVTRQRRSEKQLRRAEAMEATVTLARGVAHDFSSLLTTAIGSLSVLRSEVGNGRPAELVTRALRACGQAVGLSRTLLSFAGGERGTPEALPLRETVELITQSLSEDELQRVALRLELQEVTAYIDRDQFTEVVLNLVRNACEAMPDGGELTIRLEPAKLPEVAAAEGPATHALLTVADTGPGISPEVRERLFEPFFTTKSPGSKRSRGMGLSVVYAAVKNAGGLVDAQANPKGGAVFRVWLPFPERSAISAS